MLSLASSMASQLSGHWMVTVILMWVWPFLPISILHFNPAVNNVGDFVYAVRQNYLLWLERRFNPVSLTSLTSFYSVSVFCHESVFMFGLFSSCAFHWSENNVVSWLFSVVLFDDTIFHSAKDFIWITDLAVEKHHYKSEPI